MTKVPSLTPIDELWRRIVNEIPSAHIRGELTIHAFGFRRALMMLAGTKQYLEVGCRLGHSLAAVLISSQARATVVDNWMGWYAGEANEGPRVVCHHLEKLHIDPLRVDFRTGDSRKVLPELRGLFYDVILVDGDRTLEGAQYDLINCLPLLAPGGVLYFDDYNPPLDDMVRTFVAANHLSMFSHLQQGEIPGWCVVCR